MKHGGRQRGGAAGGIIVGVVVGATLMSLTGDWYWLPVALTLGAVSSAVLLVAACA